MINVNGEVDVLLKQLEDLINQLDVVELSHTLEEHIPIWPTHSRYLHTLWHSYWHGDDAIDYQLLINEHNGTHVDAPAHFIREGNAHKWINEMPIKSFFGSCITMDMSFLGKRGILTKEQIILWEEQNEEIQENDIVFINFGWARYWKNRPEDKEYVNDWPGVGRSAAEYLRDKKVKMVGVDTLAVDAFKAEGDPAHYALLGNEILVIENLNNLDKLTKRCYFMALPLPIKEGSASPIRAIALIEK